MQEKQTDYYYDILVIMSKVVVDPGQDKLSKIYEKKDERRDFTVKSGKDCCGADKSR